MQNMKSEKFRWAFVIMAALACGVTLYWYRPASELFPDSCYYIQLARNVSSGKLYVDHRAGVDRYMTAPLYPILIKAASFITRDFEKAGTLVSMLSAVLLVLALAGWGKRTFGWSACLITAWLAAFSQAKMGTLILTESLFTLLYVSAVWLLWETVQETNFKKAIWAGLLAGLATLTRELGIIIVPFGMAAMLFAGKKNGAQAGTRGLSPLSGIAAVFGATTCLVVSPYWIYSLLVRGTWWGSRFAERASHGDETFSGAVTFFNALGVGCRALLETYPISVFIVALIGIFAPAKLSTGKNLGSRIYIAAWIVWNVLVISMLRVESVVLWRRYIYSVAPLLLIFAGRGALVIVEFCGLYLFRSKPDLSRIAKYTVGFVVIALLVSSAMYKTWRLRKDYLELSFQSKLYTKGSEEVALDLLSRYSIKPDTYVYDRKPFVAYYLNATWAGLPEDVDLKDLADVAATRPVLLVVNSSILSMYKYPQLESLLISKNIPEGWHCLQMTFFPNYGIGGRLIAIYSYGDAYPPPPPVNPGDFNYEGHLQEAYMWFDRSRIDRAQAYAETAIRLDPSRPEAYILEGILLFIEGSKAGRLDVLDDSVDSLKRAVSIDPGNELALKKLCLISLAKSKIDGSAPLCGTTP